MTKNAITQPQKPSFRLFRAGMMAAALWLCASSPSFAQCADPVAPEGSQVFNSTHDVMQYCDGADWISMDGSVTAPFTPDGMGNHTASFNLDMGGHKVINLGTGTDPADAVTKLYVDSRTGAGESDPKVGALVNTKWCQGDDEGAIQCTFDAPSAGTGSGICIASDQKPAGTQGGAVVANAWTQRPLTSAHCEGLNGVNTSGGSVLLPVGQYYVDVIANFTVVANDVAMRMVVNGSIEDLPFTHIGADTGYVRMTGVINVKTAPAAIDLQYYSKTARATDGLGRAVSLGKPEVYATMSIKQISATPLYNSCTLDGQTVVHGASHIFYSVTTHANCASQSQSRVCTDGHLGGSPTYQYATCN